MSGLVQCKAAERDAIVACVRLISSARCVSYLAATGASEKTLKRVGIPYKKIYIHANNHAGYYPGALAIDLKLLFSPTVGYECGIMHMRTRATSTACSSINR